MIAKLYGAGNGNQWVEVGNTVTHMNLGVGVLGPTSGVPYLWSPGDFAIGDDGAPTLYIRGMYQGNVGIGTTSPQYPLSVNGTIQAKEVLVNTNWSDYVFDPGYHLSPLNEVADYIQANHHLPEIPSAKEVQEKEVSLGEMQSKLLAKIEELTLHMIQAEKENAELRQTVHRLDATVQTLQTGAAERTQPR